ncbi:PREDICTED: uncharacterized protein LOC109223971 [Nicotiana attenuata]|uniref:Nuclease associated modular domain-containing protein n=1 Tax=Nicotiana attenuata TaxID=49451 RepID=A0A1J6IKG7_NICAT|nr:PREDICTED: uncharacterized protein LOC109223971 [Nicotiana attenuata]OIT05210.1 hypothetical protein A4A49_02755 [Nicotiana attenuata]
MPLLDIATTQPCFQNNVCSVSSRTFFSTRFVYNKEYRLWNSFCIPQKAPNSKIMLFRGGLMIRAVATLEKGPTKNTQSNEEQNNFGGVRMGKYSGSSNSAVAEQPSEDDMELNDREKLRRMRISKANKGNTPWNKGRKHSPETLQRIRERTRLAMQDPKVKMKLVNLGHAQSEETRIKIGVAVRMGWERRRGKLMLQETCHYEWQNLIAEASRGGLQGEEELQWDSYEILNEQLEQEWIKSVEERKNMPRQKGNKRAPKSAEQRRKISEAIAAKWADPEYRTRVRSALNKYHGIVDGVERKPRRRPVSDGQTRKRSPPKKKADEVDKLVKLEPKSQVQRVRLRRKNTPMYKDPLASSKLEMLKNIRAQRAAIDQKKIEAILRAKELIAEAEKAAEALEIAAQKSPVARASLIETRKLISEAIQSIESIENEVAFIDGNLSPPSTELVSHAADEIGALDDAGERINGWHAVMPLESGINDLENGQHALQGLLNGKSSALLSSSGEYDILGDRDEVYQLISSEISPEKGANITQPSTSTEKLDGDEANESPGDEKKPLPNGLISESKIEEVPSQPPITTTKKWVRGKLVEVGEGS